MKYPFMIVLSVYALLPMPAHAYLDAGTGSVILQMILGGTAGAAMILKLFWHKIAFWKSDEAPADTGDAHSPESSSGHDR